MELTEIKINKDIKVLSFTKDDSLLHPIDIVHQTGQVDVRLNLTKHDAKKLLSALQGILENG